MKRILIVAAAMAVAWSAASEVTVTNYSWLQLAPDKVTPFVGNLADEFKTTNTSVHGQIGDYRWGNWTWAPYYDVTYYLHGDNEDKALGTWWAGVTLDQPRNVTQVNVGLWGSGTEQTNAFYIDALVNGVWTEIGYHSFGGTMTDDMYVPTYAQSTTVSVPVTAGDYQTLRVRFEVDGFRGDNAHNEGYGGPGLTMIEPVGNGALVAGERVNWANQANFGTTITNHFVRGEGDTADIRNNGGWNNGTFSDQNPWNGMNRPLQDGEYMEIDLKEVRAIDNITALFNGSYFTTSFRVWVREDTDSPFTEVILSEGAFYPENAGYKGALSYDFAEVDARYVRITDAIGGGGDGYWGISQVLVNGTVVPEPATMSLLGLGALALLRRKR